MKPILIVCAATGVASNTAARTANANLIPALIPTSLVENPLRGNGLLFLRDHALEYPAHLRGARVDAQVYEPPPGVLVACLLLRLEHRLVLHEDAEVGVGELARQALVADAVIAREEMK